MHGFTKTANLSPLLAALRKIEAFLGILLQVENRQSSKLKIQGSKFKTQLADPRLG